MRKFSILRPLFLAALAACSLWAAAGLNLPVKKVNGKQCYYYKVARGNTVYGVAQQLGVSRDQIITFNPSAADGLKPGMMLYFPVSEFGKPDPAALAAQESQSAQQVPVIRYVVSKGETLFGIGHKFGVSAESIVALNPTADRGIKAGQTLLIPDKSKEGQPVETGDFPADESAATPEQNKIVLPDELNPDKQERSLTPVPRDVIRIAGDEEQSAPAQEQPAEESAQPQVQQRPEVTVSVLMPFMTGSEKPARAAQLAAEFYGGFLIAADSLQAVLPKVNIHAYDTRNSADNVRRLLAQEAAIGQSQVIIAPDAADQLQLISDFGRSHRIMVFNPLNARDTSYISNPYMLQGTIPSAQMYAKAAEAFVARLDGFTPVLLVNNSGRDDKRHFIETLKARLNADGIVPLMVEYDGSLSASSLAEQLGDPQADSKFIFIPQSGSLSEFNKFSNALTRYKNSAAEVGAQVRLWGYPEWVTFRGEPQKEIHELSTTLYTRSFFNPEGRESRGVDNSFVKWYGHEVSDGVPAQGVLGYDTGVFILKGLASGALDTEAPQNADWQGVQSTFHLRHENDSKGLANDALYIVRFLPGDLIDAEVI